MARGKKGNKNHNGGDLGFEQTLWLAADKLRGNLDAADYKHVVLGLIFLKYISDAFQERFNQLKSEPHADPRATTCCCTKSWRPSDKPDWLDKKTYREKIQSRLLELRVSSIMSALGVSRPYATDVRAGKRGPHPWQWGTLAKLLGIIASNS